MVEYESRSCRQLVDQHFFKALIISVFLAVAMYYIGIADRVGEIFAGILMLAVLTGVKHSLWAAKRSTLVHKRRRHRHHSVK